MINWHVCLDFPSPWLGLANSTEQYVLRYESRYLNELGHGLDNIRVSAVMQKLLRHSVLASM